MNSKNLLIGIVIIVGMIVLLGWKVKTATNTNNNEAVSLSTDPSPLRLGENTFVITVRDNDGKLVDNATVFFDINMTAMNMGTQQGNATSMGNGKYSATGRLSMRGPWKVATKVTMPDGSLVKKDFVLNVK